MTNLIRYCSNLGDREKLILCIAGGILIVTVGLAVGHAIVTGGAVIASGKTVIAIGGAAARMLA